MIVVTPDTVRKTIADLERDLYYAERGQGEYGWAADIKRLLKYWRERLAELEGQA